MGTEHNFLSAKLFLMVNQARPSSFTVSRGPFNVRAQGARGPPMLQQLRKSAKKAQRLKRAKNCPRWMSFGQEMSFKSEKVCNRNDMIHT